MILIQDNHVYLDVPEVYSLSLDEKVAYFSGQWTLKSWKMGLKSEKKNESWVIFFFKPTLGFEEKRNVFSLSAGQK